MLTGSIVDEYRYIWWDGGLYAFGTSFTLGNTIKVYVTGKNTSNIPIRLGLYWVVWGPDGRSVNNENMTLEEKIAVNSTLTGRGRSFTLNLKGTYTIDIILYGYNETTDKWEELDTWSGALCSAGEGVATYHLEVVIPSWEEEGCVVYPGSGDYAANSTLEITAYPYMGYRFLYWGGDASGTDPTYNLLMDSDKTVEAHFEPVATEEGEIIAVRIAKAPEGTLAIPATVKADGNAFEVVVDFENTSSEGYVIGCKPVVTDPLGNAHEGVPKVDRTYVAAGVTAKNLGPFQFPVVNISGEWKITVVCALDDGTVIASLGPVVCLSTPALTGEITKKLVNCGSVVNEPMPADIPSLGERFEFRIYFKNTCETSYDARIAQVTRFPGDDGEVAKSESGAYHKLPPGVEKIQDFDIVPVDRAGEWTTIIWLLTRAGEELAKFEGVCIVAAGPTGKITAGWFDQGSHVGKPFGSKIEADGQPFEVGVQFQSTTKWAIEPGVKAEVWDPDGLKQPTPPIDYPAFGMDYLDEVTAKYQFGAVDKAGEWTIRLTLQTREGDILDEWPGNGEKGVLFTAIPVAEFSDLRIVSYSKKAAAEALVQPQQVTVQPDDALVVDVSFKYTSPAPITIDLVTVLYIPPGIDYSVPHSITLEQGVDKTWTGSVEIPITDTAGLRDYTYHLLASLPAYGLSDQVDNAVTCIGMPAGVFTNIGELIGPLILIMVMSLMMSIMTGPEGIIPAVKAKPGEIVRPIIQVFTGKSEST